jgi:hypothetical protein
MYELLREHAREVDDYFLKQTVSGHVLNHSMIINYDDLAVEAYYILNRPLKKIVVNVTLNKKVD